MDILKKHLLGFVFVVGFLCSPCNAFSQAKLAVPVQVRDDMSNTDVCANFKATPSIQISLLFGTEISEGNGKNSWIQKLSHIFQKVFLFFQSMVVGKIE